MVRRTIGLLVLLGVFALLCFPVQNAYSAGEPAQVMWPTGPTLDQGMTPECVGYGTEAWLEAGPNAYPANLIPNADWLYWGAYARDGITELHDGTTAEGAVAYLEEYGYVDSVTYTTSADAVADFVLNSGPVMVESEWDATMYRPADNGQIAPGGAIEGYHFWLVYGYDRANEMFYAQNSWGDGWDIGGHFLLTKHGLSYLLTNPQSDLHEAVLAHKSVSFWQDRLANGW